MRIHGHQLRKAATENQRLSTAVRIKRHFHAIRRIAFGDAASDAALGNHADLETEADKVLTRAEVVIPEDLTFNPTPQAVGCKGGSEQETAPAAEKESAGQTAAAPPAPVAAAPATKGQKRKRKKSAGAAAAAEEAEAAAEEGAAEEGAAEAGAAEANVPAGAAAPVVEATEKAPGASPPASAPPRMGKGAKKRRKGGAA